MDILINHFFVILEVSRPEIFETETLAKMGLETSLET